MSKTIEAMAKAIYEAEYDRDTYPFERQAAHEIKLATDMAKAALSIIREPTAEMLSVLEPFARETHAIAWRAMINKLLQE